MTSDYNWITPVCCIKCDEHNPPGERWWGMYVCKTCGNKRCPKANNHELECTRSNEPGQPGSAYEFC